MNTSAHTKPYPSFSKLIVQLLIILFLFRFPTSRPIYANAAPIFMDDLPDEQMAEGLYLLHLPLVSRNWSSYTLPAPNLNPIQNSDGDNFYEVTWSAVPEANTYSLQVASDAGFTNPVLAYEGPNLFLTYTTGQLPGSYFYRVRANNQDTSSIWSETQSIIIYPLHVGLNLRWDGVGTLYLDTVETVGTHETARLDKMMDADTIQMSGTFWYDPNPEEWESESYFVYYSVSTGKFISSPDPGDPSWKWGYSWKLAYGARFNDMETVYIDGEPFVVRGPISGMTSIGFVQYWEFTNQKDILYYDDGEGFTQIVHPGEAVLRYECGRYGLLVFDQIKRNVYYEGSYLGYWVRYTTQLTGLSTTPAGSNLLNLAPAAETPRSANQPLPSTFR